tara:strand:- start:473 stop:1630 length:1158 start_codon:yes stop_codon:yes gene_type:complete
MYGARSAPRRRSPDKPMRTFPFAHAGVEDGGPVSRWIGWQVLAGRCLTMLPDDGVGVGLLYVTDPLGGDLAEILEFLRTRTGVTEWTGAVVPAICAPGIEYFDTPAMAMMLLDVPPDRVRPIPVVMPRLAEGSFAIIHAKPHAPGIVEEVAALANESGAYLVGGLVTSQHQQPLITAAQGGLAGLQFDPEVPVATGLTQGCSPIGPAHEITAMVEGLVAELDGRPALEILKEDVGELLTRDLRRLAGYVHAALPVPGSDQADYVVRNLVGMEPSRGLVAVAEVLDVGNRLMFVRRDAASAVEDMRRMLEELRRRAGDRIRGAVYHSCVARGPHLFGPGAREMAMITEAFGNIPLVGFFGNGEISHNRLYTYTGILSLFLDDGGAE